MEPHLVADVEVSDQYTVTLTTSGPVTDLQPSEAMALAAELLEAAGEAVTVAAEDARSRPLTVHGFDQDVTL